MLRVVAATVVLGAGAAPAWADDTGFAYSHDLRRERGRLCMTDHYHFGSGSGSTRKAAEREAIRSWVDFTDFEYGSDWARFGRAGSKGMSCSKGPGGVDCQLQARPCK
jgi:hypothetical protein